MFDSLKISDENHPDTHQVSVVPVAATCSAGEGNPLHLIFRLNILNDSFTISGGDGG
jgi:hypothetical protein